MIIYSSIASPIRHISPGDDEIISYLLYKRERSFDFSLLMSATTKIFTLTHTFCFILLSSYMIWSSEKKRITIDISCFGIKCFCCVRWWWYTCVLCCTTHKPLVSVGDGLHYFSTTYWTVDVSIYLKIQVVTQKNKNTHGLVWKPCCLFFVLYFLTCFAR